jgi:hypothetical protein
MCKRSLWRRLWLVIAGSLYPKLRVITSFGAEARCQHGGGAWR